MGLIILLFLSIMSLVLSDQRPPASCLPSATYSGKAGNPTPNNLWLPATGEPTFNNVEVTGTLTTGSLDVTGDVTASGTVVLAGNLAVAGDATVGGYPSTPGNLACASYSCSQNGFYGAGLTTPAIFPLGCLLGNTIGGNAIFQNWAQVDMGGGIINYRAFNNPSGPETVACNGNKLFFGLPTTAQLTVFPDPRIKTTGGDSATPAGYVVNFRQNQTVQSYSRWFPDGSCQINNTTSVYCYYGIFFF
jgi:hypothetical protein